jgi:hypothetical protein
MKILVLSNERIIGAHDDVHRAIENLKQKKIISEYFIYPFPYKLSQGLSLSEVNEDIIAEARKFQPTALLWMHTGTFKVFETTLTALRSLESKPVMGYWDGDLFQSPFRPIPKEMLSLTSSCDVVFVQGFGEMTEKMQEAGCKDIRFVPAYGDHKKFTLPLQKKEEDIEFVAMSIGTNLRSLNPFRPLWSGTKFRKRVIKEFCKVFEHKFAIYGLGWSGICAKGKLEYKAQSSAYNKSKTTIAVNNVNAQYYFSDRLPIAMLSGIPLIHSYEKGFEKLFKNCPELRFFKSPQEAIFQVQELLKKSQEELNFIGEQLHIYALKYFTADFAFEYKIKVLEEIYKGSNLPEKQEKVLNPWLDN